MSTSDIAGIGGNPTDEEVVAIVAAIEMAWPKPGASSRVAPSGVPAWRFSGRWWAKPIAAVRQRP